MLLKNSFCETVQPDGFFATGAVALEVPKNLYLNITHVCLQHSTKPLPDVLERVEVFLKLSSSKQKTTVANLLINRTEQVSVNLWFCPGDEMTWSTSAKSANVNLLGNWWVEDNSTKS